MAATRAKRYLEEIARTEKKLRTLKAKIDHFHDFATSITPHITDTPVSHSMGSSRVESGAVGIIDGLEDWNANLGAYKAILDEAQKLIDKIPQERYRMLLSLHYLAGMSLRSVGDELRYKDRNSVYRAHGWALLEMEQVLQEEGMGE